MFFFVTLYMQNVLGYSQLQAGAAYIPVTLTVAIAAGIGANLFVRIGTRPIIVIGAVAAAGAVFWLSKIPVHGNYLSNLMPALLIMAFGLGWVFVGVNTAANAGVPPDKAGLAAALINMSTWLGGALGLAVFTVIATSRTRHLLAAHDAPSHALTAGFQRALLACAVALGVAAVIAFKATNTKGEQLPASEAPHLEAIIVSD
jgi:MFS family permease